MIELAINTEEDIIAAIERKKKELKQLELDFQNICKHENLTYTVWESKEVFPKRTEMYECKHCHLFIFNHENVGGVKSADYLRIEQVYIKNQERAKE